MEATKKRIHFIAIGGSVMHNLAIAVKEMGYEVTGSDDEIFEPSKSNLSRHGLLPPAAGWRPELLDNRIEAVILGMHASADNPELLRARELDIPVMSLPDFVYRHARDKQRIVIAGSHGKTTITAMVIHVLNHYGRKFDYVVGARVKGLDKAVRLSDAPIIVIEGDEYLASALDPTPKFLRYRHHIGLISGIAWDHANVFPSEEEYVRQFDLFADQTPKGGILVYCEPDSMALMIGKKERVDVTEIAYNTHPHTSDNDGHLFLTDGKEKYPLKIFGSHNLQNIAGAKEILKRIGVTTPQFYEAISSFEGAAGRLELIAQNSTSAVYKDFAHAPSKVRATVRALRELRPSCELVACLELHSYSSLNKKYLPQYRDSLSAAQHAIVYFNPEKVRAKELEAISEEDIQNAFGMKKLKVFNDASALGLYLETLPWKNKTLVMMSSGDFGGTNIVKLAEKILV